MKSNDWCADMYTKKVPREPDAKLLANVRSQKCVCCMGRGRTQTTPTEVDHIKTRGSGGGNQPWNLAPVCVEHHRARHNTGITTFINREPGYRAWMIIMGWEFDGRRWNPPRPKDEE